MGLRAFSGGSSVPLTPQQQIWRAEALPIALALIATEYFDVEIGQTFPLDEAAAAQDANENGAAGKIIIVP
jgi:NADPH:quinone reductase-like Zn-dependent oxidoreductase